MLISRLLPALVAFFHLSTGLPPGQLTDQQEEMVPWEGPNPEHWKANDFATYHKTVYWNKGVDGLSHPSYEAALKVANACYNYLNSVKGYRGTQGKIVASRTHCRLKPTIQY